MRRLSGGLAILSLLGCGDDGAASSDAAPASPDAAAADSGGGGTDAADGTAPQILSTTPADAETGVSAASSIIVRFDEAMAPASFTVSSFFLELGVTIDGTIEVEGSGARFTPAAPLDALSEYTFTVTSAVTDVAGNPLATDYVFRFTTGDRRRVFVTSVAGTGNLSTWPEASGLGGLSAGDAICQTRAVAAGLDGAFIAWLSDTNRDAWCRVQGRPGKKATNCGGATLPSEAGPWMRVDGQPWAGRLGQLLTPAAPQVYTPVLLDEFGVARDTLYFSNTTADGIAVAGGCSDWTGETGSVGYGGSRVTGTYWTQWGSFSCLYPAPLLCVEVGVGPSLAFPASTGKRAFVTSTTMTGILGASPDAGGATGIAAGDAICRARAAAAGLPTPTSFKAWLSDSTAGAASRFVSDGPWARLDGVPVAGSKADLTDGSVASTINLTETGQYVTDAQAWTGTTATGLAALYHCGDWTTGMLGAYTGRVTDIAKWSYGPYAGSCAATHRLYCLED